MKKLTPITDIIFETNDTHGLNLVNSSVTAIANYCLRAGYEESVNKDQIPDIVEITLTNAEQMNAYNPLQTKKITASKENTFCAICKADLKNVLLSQDRKALFCDKHMVVYPYAN